MAWRCHHCAYRNRGPSNVSTAAESNTNAAPCQNIFRRPRCNHKACRHCVLDIANPKPAEAELKQVKEMKKSESEQGRCVAM